MKMLAFAASHRTDSLNAALLNAAVTYLQTAHTEAEITTHPFDFFDLPMFNDAVRLVSGMPPHADALAEAFRNTDALLIASPEYNWSIPAGLKNLLDWLSCYRPVPLSKKPVFLMCATPSERGGVVGLGHLKTTLEGMGALPYPAMMTLGRAPASLDDPKKQQQLQTQLDNFMAYATRLCRS
jgi:chromate reductase, NAD(P)H dehydrogenase (quinone)